MFNSSMMDVINNNDTRLRSQINVDKISQKIVKNNVPHVMQYFLFNK